MNNPAVQNHLSFTHVKNLWNRLQIIFADFALLQLDSL